MSSYHVEYTEKAFKQLSKMDRPTKRIIMAWIDKNLEGTDDPRRFGKPLTGNLKKYWRYRIGDYRIIADIQDDKMIIVAVFIDHREKVYNIV